MKIIARKGAKSNFKLDVEGDSFLGKMIAGAKGKVKVKTPFGTYEPDEKDKKKLKKK